ncbi:MAG: threonine synthase [Bacillota bacterium]
MFHYDYAHARFDPSGRSIWRFRSLLPVRSRESEVSLGEGLTPLVASRLSLGCRLWLKDEGRNPTGSMKDRALSVAVSAARESGKDRVIIASTGSAGMAASAYAARAGMRCLVLVPRPTSRERLVVMAALGAEVVEVDGTFEDLMEIIGEARRHGWEELTTYRKANPHQGEGPKTIAYELHEQLGQVPEAVVVPVGGGGTLAAIWRGFQDLLAMGLIQRTPRMIGVQNVHFNALELALQRGLQTEEEIIGLGLDAGIPVITRNLKHAFPPDSLEALNALRQSGGTVVSVTDEEAVKAQVELARTDGLFAEPSSAVTLAAIAKLVVRGELSEDAQVVAILSGSGLREVQTAVDTIRPVITEATVAEALERVKVH